MIRQNSSRHKVSPKMLVVLWYKTSLHSMNVFHRKWFIKTNPIAQLNPHILSSIMKTISKSRKGIITWLLNYSLGKKERTAIKFLFIKREIIHKKNTPLNVPLWIIQRLSFQHDSHIKIQWAKYPSIIACSFLDLQIGQDLQLIHSLSQTGPPQNTPSSKQKSSKPILYQHFNQNLR